MENINLQQVDKTETRMTMDGMREGYPSLTVHVPIAWGRIILRKKKGALLDAVRNNLLALVKHAYKTEMQANDGIYIDAGYWAQSDRHISADTSSQFSIRHVRTEQFEIEGDFSVTFFLQNELLELFRRYSISPKFDITVSNCGGLEYIRLDKPADIDRFFRRAHIPLAVATQSFTYERLEEFVDKLRTLLLGLGVDNN